MADIFISFTTGDTPRIQPLCDAFRVRGLTVFWSNDIPKGAPDYRAVLLVEMRKAAVVVVMWTHASVESQPVAQECSQATRDNKLFQVVLDDLEPMQFPMEAGFRAQKTNLIGWTGDTGHPEWVNINKAIDERIGRTPDTVAVEVATAVQADAENCSPGSGLTKWFKDLELAPEMVVVPAGMFYMGAPEREGDADEKPRHAVWIAKPFAVGRYAITFAEWDAAVEAHGLPSGASDQDRDYDEGWGRGRRPVINVSWADAKSYVMWLSQQTKQAYRLLTEAEWEYCCRAGTTTTYPFPDALLKQHARFGDRQTMEVGWLRSNAWGLHDMHGNVWEWVEDDWHLTYDGAPNDGSAWADGQKDYRVIRGGSWVDEPYFLRSAERRGEYFKNRRNRFGFRVARTL